VQQRLLGNFSDADLTRLEVDAQILPLVRLVIADIHLDVLEHILPEAQ
jgi:hypothetical protein